MSNVDLSRSTGSLGAWLSLVFVVMLPACAGGAADPTTDPNYVQRLESALRSSGDDYDLHSDAFLKATLSLVKTEGLTIDMIQRDGGWVRSSFTGDSQADDLSGLSDADARAKMNANQHAKQRYFIYVGGFRNKWYLDAVTGKLSRQ